MIDGKSKAWRDAADKLMEALARENKFIVADMVIIFLESAGYSLKDYTPLGGVFKRAAIKGIIKKVNTSRRQALWSSLIYNQPMTGKIESMVFVPKLEKGMRIGLKNFGAADGDYRIADIEGDSLRLVADND